MSLIVTLDVETTGLNAERDSIIQFSAIKTDENMENIDILDIYIQCEHPIPDYITKINHISDETLREKGISQKEAICLIRDFCCGCNTVMGHNVTFDLKFLNALFQKNGIPEMDFLRVIDTLAMARNKVEGSHKLEVLAKQAGFDGEFHNSLEDVKATIEVYKWLQTL